MVIKPGFVDLQHKQIQIIRNMASTANDNGLKIIK